MPVKGPETYLARVSGNDRRFVRANHLIPVNVRGLGSHVEKVAPDVLEKNPYFDFQEGNPSVPMQIHKFRLKTTVRYLANLMLFLYQLLKMISN